MTEQRLLPCPFCGHEPEFERLGTPRQSCIVACGYCGCRHESSDEGANCGRSWNERAILSADRGEPVAWLYRDVVLAPMQPGTWSPVSTLKIAQTDPPPEGAFPVYAAAPSTPQPAPETGQLHPDRARSVARTALGYAQAFDGKGIDWHSDDPWPHRSELAQALDWITDLGAMVLNLADRVATPQPDTVQVPRSCEVHSYAKSDDSAKCLKCGHYGHSWWCEKSPTLMCQYDGDMDHCIHCGQPEERK